MTAAPQRLTPRTRPATGAAYHALLSGGGSGGHVFPGLAVAEELARRGWQVSWAGTAHGPEARLVGERQIAFYPLAARPVVGQGLAGKARALATLVRSTWSARALVRRLEARVVVGTGGYACAAAVIGARLAARPVLLIEPNVEPGVANRLLSRLASEAAVAWDEAGRTLGCPSRTTGIPVRAEFLTVPAELPPPPLRLLVLGGSQGARQVNELLPPALALFAGTAGAGDGVGALTVCHQAGAGKDGATREAYRDLGLLDADSRVAVEVVPFLDDVAAALARSHLVVSRAGAITLAEVCAAGRASLLVPLALAGGHQGANARHLTAAGAAETLAPAASARDLADTLARLLGDRARLTAMAAAARRLGHGDAAAAIADRVEALGQRASAGAAEEGV